MPLKRTHYEILGVPRTATQEQIKKRYRQLVRKYHPDVAQDKVAAGNAFLQISEAYQTLTDSDRRVIYDAELDREIAGPTPRPARPSTSSSGGYPGGGYSSQTTSDWQRTSQRSRTRSAERFIRDAQAALARGQYWVALDCARDAVSADHQSVQAYITLGDVYRMQNRMDEAVAAYTVVLQFDPNNAEAMEKLGKAMRRSKRVGFTDASAERMQALRTGVTLISGSIGVFVLLMLAISPGEPIPWLRTHLPLVASWSPMLITTLLAVGALAGLLMSMTDGVRALDDELVFQTVSAGRQLSYPIGLILVLLNLFSFYVAVGTYFLAGIVQGSISGSVVKAFVATVCILALVAVIYTSGTREVLIWGGNLVFASLVVGWAIGDFIKPWG